MSDPTAQEPTMEEILASIRRIISEDDAPVSEPAAAPTAAEPKAAAPVHLAPVPAPADDEDDEVLDLTEPAPPAAPTPAPRESLGDLDVFDAEPPKPKAPEPKPPEIKAPEPKAAEPTAPEPRMPEPLPEPVKAAPVMEEPAYKAAAAVEDDRLISGGTEVQAASHFGKLAQSIAMPPAGRQLEDVVSELLKPLLKDWLDQHLPAIVEEKVQAEVERIARRR